jgi:polyisoprenoid-binding protein YceI/rhodanese-related sulfurtransferase
MPIPIVTRDQLKNLLHDDGRPVLIDTSLPEDFAAAHIAGARNACVFEIGFLGQVEGLEGIKANALARVVGVDPHRNVPIVVYGPSARSLASTTAAEKLGEAGFTDVRDYRGGLAEWRAGNLPVGGDIAAEKMPPPLEDRDYEIDLEESAVEWTGRSLGGKHQGTLALLPGGIITLRGGRAIGGRFTMDMATITDTDLPDAAMRGVLEGHLKSDDFFDVEKYPHSSFALDVTKEIAGAPLGSPNYTIRGRLLLKGIEKPLSFPAQVGHAPEGDGSVVARANFDLDRTDWNVLYGSGKFYERLGKHLVSNFITLDLKIVAR